MPMGKHYGAFAKGFADSLIAMMRLSMTKELYDARAQYYRDRGYAYLNPRLSPQQQRDAELQNQINQGKVGFGGGGGPPPNASDFEKFKYGLTGEESGGKYNVLGPVVKGDQAIGRYQIMGKNVGPWTEQYLGKRMTPEEFRNDPVAQDKVFEGKVNDLYKQYGNWRDVASVWHSGVDYNTAVAQGRRDVNETTARYVDHVMANARLGGTSDPATITDRTGYRQDVQPVTATTDDRTGLVKQADDGPNHIYANIPFRDDQGRDQLPMFMRWNSDPVGNEAANLKQINPDMQRVIARARQDNPNLKFVLGNGKRSAADQDWAKSVGWSKVGSKDGGDAAVHMKGNAADLWALDGNGRVTFDPGAQSKVTAAIKKAAQEEGVKLNAGEDWKHPDKPHFELASPTGTAKAPTKGPDKGKVAQANEGPPILHTPYQVAGPTGDVSEAGAERAAADLAAHRAPAELPDEEGYNEPSVAARARALGDRTAVPSEIGTAVETATPSAKDYIYPPSTDFPTMLPPLPTPPPGYTGSTGATGGTPAERVGAPGYLHSTSATPPPAPVPGGPAYPPPNVYPQPGYARSTSAVLPPRQPDSQPNQGGGYPAPAIPRTAEINAPVVGGDERRQPAVNPNAPAPAAQPVSATQPSRAVPTTPAQDPRFTQVTAPNSDPTARNRPQMTALDLSHLWGPNPPVAQRAPAPPGPPPPPVARSQDQNFDVGSPDMSDVALGMQLGAAKGGPITQRVSFAKGGAIPSRPTIKLAAGGTAPAYSILGSSPYSEGAQVEQQMQSLVPTGGTASSMNSAYNALTPAQQQWYTQASQDIGKVAALPIASRATMGDMIYNQLGLPPTTPAATPAATPTPTPALAPTIVNPPSVQNITTYQGTASDPSGVNAIDPTSTTTTGVPGVANTVTANTYDPNKIATTGTGSATDSTGGTNYSTDQNDQTKQILSRKGGPIKRFAAGGAIPTQPTMGFAAGGTPMSYFESPSYVGPTITGGWSGSTPYSALAPNQQAWADQTRNVLGQISTGGRQDAAYWSGGGQSMTGPVDTSPYFSQLTAMPDAIWPTTTPAAPTPIPQPPPSVTNITSPQTDITGIDPTSTTTTGTPGVPTTGALAKTYDPNNIATTGTGSTVDASGGTNYSTDPNDQTTQILSRKGGPITRRVTVPDASARSIGTRKYDDGGGVSPSVAGAPPGATGGAPIPPIYYNPATYAAAGAPVGKGVSATSAPTYGAGAIPSLPMARGGVVGYDDGGMVGDEGLNTMQAMDLADAREDQGGPPAPPSTPTTQYNSAGEPITDVDPNEFLQAPTAPQQPAAPLDHSAPPPDPTTPQIKDDQGNPSRGLIGAISDGLHWLGDHLGLVGSAQAHPAIATSPEMQTRRQQLVSNDPNGATYITHANVEELNNVADPNHELQDAYRNIAGLEAGYKWALSRGDDATASRLAASILHYSVITSQNLSAEAAKSLYKGDMKDAVDKLNQASDAIPDGRLVHATLNPDGTVTIQGKNLNGQVEWQKHGAAATILEHATSLGRSGKLQWDSLESQAAKYDHTFAEMAKNRQANQIAQGKEDQQRASEERVAGALGGNTLQPVTPRVTSAPAPGDTGGPGVPASATAPTPAPAPTPAAAPAPATAPAPAPASGGTPTATPPSDADENRGQGPTVENAAKGAGLPPQPSSADLPSGQAQKVSFDDIAARIDQREATTNAADVTAIRGRYFTPEGNIIYGGQEYARPQPPNVEGLSKAEQAQALQAYQKGPLAQFNAMAKENQDAMNKDIADNRDLRSKQFQTLRDRARDQAAEQGRAETQAHADTAAATRAKTQQDFEKQKETDARTWDLSKPRDPKDVAKTFTTAPDENGQVTGKEPAAYMASALGLVKSDGSPDVQALNAKLDRNQQAIMAQALQNGYAFSPHADVGTVADLVTGLVTNPGYIGHPTAISPDQTYGVPRASITVQRPDGTTGTFVLPEEDLRNLKALAKTYGAAQPKPAAPKPAPALPPLSQRFRPPTPPSTLVPRQVIPGRPPQMVQP